MEDEVPVFPASLMSYGGSLGRRLRSLRYLLSLVDPDVGEDGVITSSENGRSPSPSNSTLGTKEDVRLRRNMKEIQTYFLPRRIGGPSRFAPEGLEVYMTLNFVN